MKMKSLFLVSVLAVAGLVSLTSSAAIFAPATATGFGVDDTNTSTLNPNTINAGKNTPTYFTGQCPFITDGMNSFVAANPNYTWTWAVPAFNLQSDLTVSDYYAWVVTSP